MVDLRVDPKSSRAVQRSISKLKWLWGRKTNDYFRIKKGEGYAAFLEAQKTVSFFVGVLAITEIMHLNHTKTIWQLRPQVFVQVFALTDEKQSGFSFFFFFFAV